MDFRESGNTLPDLRMNGASCNDDDMLKALEVLNSQWKDEMIY
jgi:hypothetical protein